MARIELTTTQSVLSAYFQLLKPRVITLVIFTGGVGLWMSGGQIEWWRALLGMLFLGFGAGAAGALNMWYEREADAKMQRTKNRPLPSGTIQPEGAFVFGLLVSFLSVVGMAIWVDLLASVILGIANLYYVLVYTVYLKPRTAQNIVIGGAAGAFPPVIGWAMATGEISWVSISLFALIFAWTPAHSWALALYKSDDYAAGGFPMLPVVAGEDETKRQIVVYSFIQLFVSLVPWIAGGTGWLYGVVALGLGLVFLTGAFAVLRAETGNYEHAKKLFGFSILYLSVLFLVAAIDARSVVQFL